MAASVRGDRSPAMKFAWFEQAPNTKGISKYTLEFIDDFIFTFGHRRCRLRWNYPRDCVAGIQEFRIGDHIDLNFPLALQPSALAWPLLEEARDAVIATVSHTIVILAIFVPATQAAKKRKD